MIEDEDLSDVGDVKVVKKRKTKRELRREMELRAIEIFLENPDNRYFIWRLLSKCGMYDSMSWADPHTMAVLSGKRDIGLWVLAECLTAKPEVYDLMRAEAHEREKRDK